MNDLCKAWRKYYTWATITMMEECDRLCTYWEEQYEKVFKN